MSKEKEAFEEWGHKNIPNDEEWDLAESAFFAGIKYEKNKKSCNKCLYQFECSHMTLLCKTEKLKHFKKLNKDGKK